MDKSFRIHTNIISDTLLKVNMQQDFDFLEVLSLELRQKDAYRLHSSNYGVIIGRVLANDAFGIPNAKVSIFIERDTNDSTDMEALYPYSEVSTKDKEGRRYNILPDYSDDDCYRVVGTFPNKRLMLDDDIQLEIYEKYYIYTTVTNNAGDYMIFGVPTGSVTVHVDIDLSDIGVLSQKPRDFEYKGYNLTMFDSPNQFKESTNLDGLAQIFSQNRSVFVYPFWGDADNGIASITRADIQIQYKFEPTCVFMGSIISDNEGHAIGHKCAPDIDNGMNNQLIGGSGTIEMIRRTTDGLVEEYQIQGNQLIDENGVWCYQIPMNLDYIGTDEYGNVVPTDNPTKGIPTRTQVRFRISKNETADEGFSRHTAKYLVPMNPIFAESGTTIGGLGTYSKNGIVPVINTPGAEIEKMYNFGSATPDHCFRDLYWNNVYSVKNYIPKVQVAHRAYSKNYGALKGSNLADDQNPIPFNKLRIDVPFTYMLICILITLISLIIFIINALLCVVYTIINTINTILKIVKKIPLVGTFIPTLDWLIKYLECIPLSAGINEGNTAFYPGCWCDGFGDCPEEMEGDCEKSKSRGEYMDRIQRNLAQEFKIIKLDLYQDWINGTLYMPLWYWRKRKKRSYWLDILGLFRSSAKNDFCSCETDSYSRLKTYVTCEIPYRDNTLEVDGEIADEGEKRWHKNRAEQVRYRRGLIRPFVNKDDLTVYYYAALQATSNNANSRQTLAERPENFYAVRLYATDIILLGNLIENNLYGIPQFFKCLPSTTANIPAIATIEEEEGEDEKDTDNIQYDASTDTEENGNTVVTGMDWRRARISEDDSPRYRQGLFMDLGCTFADTKAKSCINVERLSELGVSLDSSYTMRYAHDKESKIKSGQIKADGFITKLELDDMENRAMFATMNHIGFIPQTYQESISGYATQVPDENTNYLIPKFKYIYPVDFDGRQQVFMTRYKNGFKQPMYDEKDDNSYVTFRLGAESGENFKDNSEHRVRHFYKVPTKIDPNCTGDGNAYYMPLYNNSFYFYFGIKKGSTAIDKFNEMFYAECFQNDKKPFSIFLDTRPRSYCPEVYKNPLDGYAFIRVNADDIKVPFTYTLYDEKDTLVISESGMTTRDFIIGGHFESGTSKPQANENGTISYQKEKEKSVDIEPYKSSGLTNQMYYLTLTDSDGRSVTERITLDMPKINAEYKTTNLSAKFYSSAATRIDYICHEDNHFYGIIDITGFTCDGYDCIIDDTGDANYSEDSGYTICISGHSDDISDVSSSIVAYFSIKSMEWDENHRDRETKNCMCDVDNVIASVQTASSNMKINEERAVKKIKEVFLGMDWNKYIYDKQDKRKPDETKGKKVSFFVYQPNSFVATIIQGCKSCTQLALDNANSTIITIYNADNFNTYLNTMPTVFMIGSVNDSVNASVANGHYGTFSKFYSLNAENIKNPINSGIDSGITGWFGVHQESSYMFSIEPNEASDKNKNLWEDYIRVNDDIHMQGMKRNILEMKFNSMFALSDAVYIRNEGQNNFEFTATGGTQPVLIRSIAPYYDDESKFLAANNGQSYLFKDNGMVTFPTNYPNVVGLNASGHSQNTGDPEFSSLYMNGSTNNGHRGLIGNYFAGFTHNGGYVPGTKNKLVKKPSILRQPNFASISPYQENVLKYLGVDDERPNIEAFEKVYEQGEQDLTKDGDSKKRIVNPWLRALNIDRRYDYDLTILGPVIGENFRLHTEDNKERPWKSLRISGFTYNGIEMSYDDEYNIISATTVLSADTTGEVIKQRANKRLEYSYYYSDGDKYAHTDSNDRQVGISPYLSTPDEYGKSKYMEAVTLYNHEENQVWSKMHDIVYNGKHFGFDGGKTIDKIDENYQIIKEPYVNEFAGFDLRNFYWSSFNKERLNRYVNNDGDNSQLGGKGIGGFCNLDNPFYVFQYPYEYTTGILYNYDFNREDVLKKKTYPTKRFIDIGNIYPSLQYLFTNEGCSYGMKVSKGNDGFIKCKVKSKEETNFNLNFIQPIKFISPNATNKEFGNIVFIRNGGEGDCEGWKRFDAKYANLNFSYNLKDDAPFQDFDIYTKTPKLIKVLPYINETDGLTYIKSANPKSEFGTYADGKSLDDAISDVEFYTFSTSATSFWNLFGATDIYTPQGVVVSEGFKTKMGKTVLGKFFWKEGKPLNSNDNDFANIRFFKENIDLTTKQIYAFTMLIDREYVYKDDDTLTRHIRLIEFPEIYDCRHLLVKSISESDDEQGNPLLLSYVEYKKIDTVTPVNEPNGNNSGSTELEYDDKGNITGATTDVEVGVNENVPKDGQGKMYTQVLSFEMRFLKEGNPVEIQNYAFADYKNMGYIFEFIDSYGNKYFVEDGVEASSYDEGTQWKHLRFIVKWDQNMGILRDDKWAGWNEESRKGKQPVKMAIYAKTPTNFTYKVFDGDTYFLITLSSQASLPEEEGIKSKTVFCIE